MTDWAEGLWELCPECNGAGCLACEIEGLIPHECSADTED